MKMLYDGTVTSLNMLQMLEKARDNEMKWQQDVKAV